ncbi:uncharacterized protein THITE_2116459 [Thermothielavioides terrestris NRRL 8126]|uniref:Uncharacterized protein n=1 Tax=Thermothielavioides terrestris (strain ATCC 38088 / NRRL 8126) TaxID=578455 RepID=G2R626_THETT|nr:uncharacterized protein THITE_2116459 [Thermothielavioides terrestris NRRL 8126]AEO67563.1 hypothetical protein THITE_2116459 [Thermothielavioides terrestris NRRL 8126]
MFQAEVYHKGISRLENSKEAQWSIESPHAVVEWQRRGGKERPTYLDRPIQRLPRRVSTAGEMKPPRHCSINPDTKGQDMQRSQSITK